MDDCITISDDESEDVQLLKHVVHIDKEPIVIDLTCSQETCMRASAQEQGPSKIIETPPQSQHKTTHGPSHPSPEPPHMFTESFPEPTHASPQPSTETVDETSPPTMNDQCPPSPKITETHSYSQPQHKPQYQCPPHPQPNPQPQPPPESVSNPPEPPSEPSNDHPKQEADSNPKPQQTPKMSDYELMMAQKALGNEKYKHNLFDDAIRIYKRANELAKRLGDKEMSAILHFNLAMTYYKVGSFEQAADECANAVKINDKHLKAHLKRAEIYQRQGKFEEAVICYEHVCELDNTNPDYAVLLEHAKVLAKRPQKKDYYQILGLSYNFTREDLKKAYRQQALSHHPDRHSDADIVTRRIEEKRFKEASEAHSWIKLRMGYSF